MKKSAAFVFGLLSMFLRAQESQGVKPGISINGAPCLIHNLVYSCMPRTCDSIQIMAGDSVEFCTYQEIYLNTDTAYWMRWHFYGATNLPDTILNDYPLQTPVCYWPRWDSAGTYMAEAFYNGVLSAYPTSDCYQQGPSHWYIKVVVLPDPNGITEQTLKGETTVVPNPSAGVFIFHASAGVQSVNVYNAQGMRVLESAEPQADLGSFSPGIYTAVVTDARGNVSEHKLCKL